jgi:acyl-coenzyme A synthetase/AMP-(fatty) acid ligase
MDEAALTEDLNASIFVRVSQLQNNHADFVEALPVGERPSYIVYTSGTTGKPKGVTIGSGAFEAAVMSSCEALNLNPSTRILSVSPFHFDGSFAILFPTLASGGTLIIRPQESLLFPRVFFDTIIAEMVTYTDFSPSYLHSLESSLQFDNLAMSDMEIISLGGEACSVSDVENLWAVAPEVRIFNCYGPTEATITVSLMKMTRSIVARGAIPLGKPNPGVQFYLVDELGHLIEEPLVTGELYIGGSQLMDGYWKSPELTEKVIHTDIVAGQRLYQIGDVVYLDSEGDYVYVNRADRVIKRGGVRISLLEISDVFRKIDEVSAATSIAFDDDGSLGIATFLVLTSEISHAELHGRARDLLPSSMLPDRIEVVESMPFTSSGKSDERRLLSVAGRVPQVFADPSQT